MWARMAVITWKLHGDGRSIAPGTSSSSDERLSWPITSGIGAQHVVAMFGGHLFSTPIDRIRPATTLFFTGVGTILFLPADHRRPTAVLPRIVLRAHRPNQAVTGYVAGGGAAVDEAKAALAQGGVIAAGTALALVGVVVHFAEARWIDWLMPPISSPARSSSSACFSPLQPGKRAKSAGDRDRLHRDHHLVTVLFKGIIGRLSILIGVVVGYITAVLRGEVNFDAISSAGWSACHIHAPDFDVTRSWAYSCPSCSC